MAKYTVELRTIYESGQDIFPFPYDFYDENERAKFERDFIRHFYFREICVDSVDKWLYFLEDKFQTVLPYYNELFKANQIEYSVLDNYNLTETMTRKLENKGLSRGMLSARGEQFDEQTTTAKDNRTTDTTGKLESEGSTNETRNDATTENANGTTNVTNEQSTTKKFLDTPQGQTDLTNSKFLTTLNQDDSNGTTETETNTETTRTNNGSTNGGSTSTQESESKETMLNESEGSTSGTKRTIDDSNTRTETEGEQQEISELKRKGNIGIDTDADMIQKHIKLQQIMKKIKSMFFDECEDLFFQLL